MERINIELSARISQWFSQFQACPSLPGFSLVFVIFSSESSKRLMVGPADSRKNPLWDLKMCVLNAQCREYIQQTVMFPWLEVGSQIH